MEKLYLEVESDGNRFWKEVILAGAVVRNRNIQLFQEIHISEERAFRDA